MIENKGECDITFKIGPARFTFTFLVSNELTQDVILGYNFSKAFHLGTDWNKNDEMFLTMNGQQLTTTISTKAINALVQCVSQIPLVDNHSAPNLYKIYNLPAFNPTIGKSVKYNIEWKSIAVSHDKRYATIPLTLNSLNAP